MSESNDYKTFKKNVPGPRDRLDRVENVVLSGMPDINFCPVEGTECWIEQKSPLEPKRATTKLFGSNHKLTQDQMNWFMRQRTAGGRAFVLIATDKRWMLICGSHADHVNEMTVAELEQLAIWKTSKPVKGKDKWNQLRAHLVSWNSTSASSRPSHTATNSNA
jgi:hypothetical protein